MNKKTICLFVVFLVTNTILAQKFTRQDSLRGSITKERSWWDLKKYHLDIKVNPSDSTIIGSNTIDYQVVEKYNVMQIDLQEPMQITKIVQDGINLKYQREGNVYHVYLVANQSKGEKKQLVIFYGGKPKTAVNPPWDGGISWKKDENGKSFIASSCQGLGASVWWPNKDHMYDEAESMLISVNVPKGLMDISNGRLISTKPLKDNTTTYTWQVTNPINNYGVNINIGDYIAFSEKYKGEK